MTVAPRAVRRLEADGHALRQAAGLRGVAALLAAGGGVWLLLVTDSWILRVTALASLVFAALWGRTQLRMLRSAAEVADYLELGEHHLVIVQPAAARSVPLSRIQEVELDNDRLDVVLHLDDGEELRVEPRYRGVGLRELGELIHLAVRRAREDARG